MFLLPLNLQLQFGFLLVLIIKNYFISCKNKPGFLVAFSIKHNLFSLLLSQVLLCFLSSAFSPLLYLQDFLQNIAQICFFWFVFLLIVTSGSYFLCCTIKYPGLSILGNQFSWVLPSTASVCQFTNFSSNFSLLNQEDFLFLVWFEFYFTGFTRFYGVFRGSPVFSLGFCTIFIVK